MKTNLLRTSMAAVLAAAAQRGCARFVVTGSVFEPYEGVGDPGHRALNPYGLSKHLSFEILRMEAAIQGCSTVSSVLKRGKSLGRNRRASTGRPRRGSGGRVSSYVKCWKR